MYRYRRRRFAKIDVCIKGAPMSNAGREGPVDIGPQKPPPDRTQILCRTVDGGANADDKN
jgi:hypothetical protein